jgi:hypothetical protein
VDVNLPDGTLLRLDAYDKATNGLTTDYTELTVVFFAAREDFSSAEP